MKRLFVLCCALFVIVNFTNSALAEPYTGADIVLNGDEYSAISGGSLGTHWFHVWPHDIMTYWGNRWVEYQTYLNKGNWNIGLNVLNYGNIDSGWYSGFQIRNSLTNEIITIQASPTEVFHGYINHDIPSDGIYTIRYIWLNDWVNYQYHLDANIRITTAFFDLIPAKVSVDIKPQSYPNPLNVRSKGVIPVAILGTSNFNVMNIDVVSISLEGVSPIRSGYEDVAESLTEDDDGALDLTLKFDTQEIVKALDDIEDGESRVLKLSGNLTDGTPFEGEDVVVIKKKGKK